VAVSLRNPLRLRGEVDNRDEIIHDLRERIRGLEDQLSRQVESNQVLAEGVAELREFLAPLYRGLRKFYGETDGIAVSGNATASPYTAAQLAAWENWKQKLGGLPAKAIEAFLLHGALTQTQLRVIIGCATGSVPNVVMVLNKAGLINKNGGKISLKEL
jgi:hypothetical protein